MSRRADGLDGLHGYQTDWHERDETKRWLQDHCATPHEFEFWWEFYDDLEDCFDDLEPWRIYGEGYLENERRRMQRIPELDCAMVWPMGPYIYSDEKGEYPKLSSSRRVKHP